MVSADTFPVPYRENQCLKETSELPPASTKSQVTELSKPDGSRYGPRSGMGNGHKKLLLDFLNKNKNKSEKKLDIENNKYVLEIIHSIYTAIFKKNNYQVVKDKEFKVK